VALIIAAAQSASVPGEESENIPFHPQLATNAADHGVQLLVFPELSLTA
jgi:predicted amidohydrolase